MWSWKEVRSKTICCPLHLAWWPALSTQQWIIICSCRFLLSTYRNGISKVVKYTEYQRTRYKLHIFYVWPFLFFFFARCSSRFKWAENRLRSVCACQYVAFSLQIPHPRSFFWKYSCNNVNWSHCWNVSTVWIRPLLTYIVAELTSDKTLQQ